MQRYKQGSGGNVRWGGIRGDDSKGQGMLWPESGSLGALEGRLKEEDVTL